MRERRQVLYKPRVILVTGGAGFIGSNFVHYALAKSESVKIVNLDALTYAADMANLDDLPGPERHTFVRGDITDRELLDKLFHDHSIDCVAHFAAESHVDRSIADPKVFVETNVLGTFQLLEASRNAWEKRGLVSEDDVRFHHVSTDEVYGTLSETDPAFSESTPYAPNSPYSASKAGSDHLVRAYFETYGLPVTTSNCSNNYGPRQNPEKLIPTVIKSCISQAEIPVYGDGRNIRDWLYVEDHCDAIWNVITRGAVGETYNVGGDAEKRNIDLVVEICREIDKRLDRPDRCEQLIRFVTDRPGHDWRYAIDSSFIKSSLGWSPKQDFKSGIEKTISWYLT